jgi:hypothetical protein
MPTAVCSKKPIIGSSLCLLQIRHSAGLKDFARWTWAVAGEQITPSSTMLTANKHLPAARGLAPVLVQRAASVSLDWDTRSKSRFDAHDSAGRHLTVFLPRGTVLHGRNNLAATFSPELSDLTLYVIDVAGGEIIPRKGGPGITKSDL